MRVTIRSPCERCSTCIARHRSQSRKLARSSCRTRRTVDEMMPAQVERAALVDRGHDPEVVREVALANLAADPDGQLLEQVRAQLLLHRDQRIDRASSPGAGQERVARGGVGKDRLDRIAPARANPHDLLPVGPALQEDLLDRQDLARLAALGQATLPVASPDAQQPADDDAQREERTGDRDPQELRPEP